jgi:hypothetical protein
LKHIATPGETVDEIMRRVRADVSKETDNKQTPWTEDLLIEKFIFMPRVVVPQDTPARTSSGTGGPSSSSGNKSARSEPTQRERREPSAPVARPSNNLPPGLGAGAGAGL